MTEARFGRDLGRLDVRRIMSDGVWRVGIKLNRTKDDETVHGFG
jgi:hypothetical protein